MSSDPNGVRWSQSEGNVGKNMLKKAGWTEGAGLGRDQDGIVSNIKVSRKDDMMGIGYKAGVAEAWSTQSVGFADVLERIKTRVVVVNTSDSDAEGSGESPSSAHTSSRADATSSSRPTESRHYRMYAKRNALKTELLRTATRDKAEEILGSAAASRRRADEDNSGAEDDERAAHKRSRRETDRSTQSTLQSPLLSRLMARVAKHEPRPTVEHDGEEAEQKVKVTKPHPRPPKCTETPFLLH